MGAIIEVKALRKCYGSLSAVDDVSFLVDQGEIVAVLGPNGAGKTTTVEILEGYRTRDAGVVRVLGTDPEKSGREFRRRIGIVLQSGACERYLTVAEILRMYANYYPAPRPVAQLLSIIGLEEQADTRARNISGGEQRRLDFGVAMVGDPELLFLDEPTTGFDPAARRQAWRVIQNLREIGKTVLLTTHYMDEAQALADRLILMRDGKIVAQGTPQDIRGSTAGLVTIRFAVAPGVQIPSDLSIACEVSGNQVTVRAADPVAVLHRLTGWALDEEVDLFGLSIARPSLEDAYLELIQ